MTKILLIENEVDLREEVANWLALEQFEVIEAGDGLEGVYQAIKNNPDLILCDIAMPKLDGYGVLLELQSNRATLQIPFIFVTAQTSHADIRHGMSLGADDYITKPFSRRELLQAIQSRLKKKAAQEQVRKEKGDAIEKALWEDSEDTNPLRNRLVAMLSHDLRTPLTVISSANFLLRDYSSQLGEQRRLLQMNRIDASVRQLLHMLDEMLLMARSGSHLLECSPEPIDIDEFIEDIVGDFQFISAESHRIVLDKRLSGTLQVDPDLVRHISANLLSNAIKYSAVGSTVTVVLDEDMNDPLSWTIQVSDNGIGISEDDMASLFTPFARGQNVGRVKGTGLGLAIVKQAVETHRGSISVQSAQGVGTTFTVTLPKSMPTTIRQ